MSLRKTLFFEIANTLPNGIIPIASPKELNLKVLEKTNAAKYYVSLPEIKFW